VQLKPRRAFVTLAVAGSIVLAAPALGYAQSSSDYARFGAPSEAQGYAGLSFAAPSSIAVRQDDNENEAVDNENIADNDNAFDDDEDAADNENGNDNLGDFADEAAFLTGAVSDSATEIEAGKLARDHGASERVRELGDRMVREHEAAMWQAASVAAGNGVETQWQPTTDEEKARIADLNTRSGEDFDRVYLQSMVRDQRSDISRFENAESNMRDDVAAFANQHRWMLEDELRAAREVADALDVDVD
jgi:putative membrane protein